MKEGRVSSPEIYKLPQSSTLNISALARLFANTTNSYKYVFFLSLLDILRRNEFKPSIQISLSELTIEMLANVWYPHTYFKLSFGLQDKITEKLDSLELEVGEPILKFKDTDKKLLRETIAQQQLDSSLVRYVPFRILRPFFERDLAGTKDYEVDKKIACLAEAHFLERSPLFRFNKSRDKIILHRGWIEYIKENYSIVRAWASWKWLEYMQRCNPSVPAVASKLFPPQERDSLKAQTDYWKLVLRNCEVRCIYSGAPLTYDKISLDHFLPWSFVAHDQLWNLVPTLPEVNSAKSNNLPAHRYFENFVYLQHLGLSVSQDQMPESKWLKQVEPFVADLKLDNKEDLMNLEKLRKAYEVTIKPLMSLAQSQGFVGDWVYVHFP